MAIRLVIITVPFKNLAKQYQHKFKKITFSQSKAYYFYLYGEVSVRKPYVFSSSFQVYHKTDSLLQFMDFDFSDRG